MITTAEMSGPLETEAYVCEQPGGPLLLQRIVLPPLLATQVEVDIICVGLCRTDLHCWRNDWKNMDFPLVTGHEGVGIVRQVGSDVSELSVGMRVAVGWIRDSCMRCKYCDEGRENLCDKGYQGLFLSKSAGIWGKSKLEYNRMGGCFSRVQRIEARFAIRIPENIPSQLVAPLIGGGGSVYEPIADYCFPGCILTVSSVGGLGTAAIRLAKLRGVTVWVLSSSKSKRKAALNLGADKFVYVKNEDELSAIRGMVDVFLETGPASSNVLKYMSCLKLSGTYVRVGIPATDDDKLAHEFIPMLFQQQRICGSVVAGSLRMREMFQLVSDNIEQALDTEQWKSEKMAMADINRAMGLLSNRMNKSYRYIMEW